MQKCIALLLAASLWNKAYMILTEGVTIAEKYEILKPLGSGGMGTVYLAQQKNIDRTVAIKFLKCSPDDAEALERFKREAKIMSELKHRNLIASYELGVWSNTVYLAMEYVEGAPLSTLLRNGALSPAQVISVASQVSDALKCAHANGVIHRDLKPDNIVLTHEPGAQELGLKVIDFGLAKLTSDFGKTAQKLTESGCAVGSVLYMSPEQCLGKKVDGRSDIYGLGAVMYHCLAGAPPFCSDHAVAVMTRHMNDLPAPIQIQGMPIGLETVVMRCLAKAPEDRYQSAEAVCHALSMVANGSGNNLTLFIPAKPNQLGRSDAAPVEQKPKPRLVCTFQVKLAIGIWSAVGVLAVALVLVSMLQTKPPRQESQTPVVQRGRSDIERRINAFHTARSAEIARAKRYGIYQAPKLGSDEP
jgi:serine/threonine protein kinase